jgi:GWxTD domain-containing protein
MKIQRSVLIIAVLLSGTLLQAQSTKKLSKRDLAGMYSEFSFTTFETSVFHKNDSLSKVFLNLQLDDFAFLPDTIGGTLKAYIGVFYELYRDWDSKLPYDTGSMMVIDSTSIGKTLEMIIDLEVEIAYPSEQILILTLSDLSDPEKRTSKIVPIRKLIKNGNQNFKLTDENGYVLFGNALQKDSYFRLEYADTSVSKIFIRYYNRSFPLAKPPFVLVKDVTYKFEPDSFYTINLEQGRSPLLELPYNGIYHFQVDLQQPEGLTLYHFDEGFPIVNTPAQAVAPLRYLTTQREYDQLIKYKDYKVAVDSFWLQRASNKPDRAKNMIKRYYMRVENANREFSSYHEGWKTDRGLIYIIYGPPSEVYREENEEEWIYGERGNPMSIKFYFTKAENPFSDNDYRLQRSASYKTTWYIAIENWRR